MGYEKYDARTVPSKCAILDELSGQHQHQSIKNVPYLMPN